MNSRRMAAIVGLAAAGTVATAGIAFAAGTGGGQSEVLDELVTDGTLTQEQADRVSGAFQEHREERRAEHEQRRAEFEQLVADTVGLSTEEIRDRVDVGETLGEIAGDQRAALADALVAERSAHIDEQVAEGRLTAEQAEEMKAELPERVDAMLDGEGRPMGGPGHRHGPGGPGEGEDGQAEASQAADVVTASGVRIVGL